MHRSPYRASHRHHASARPRTFAPAIARRLDPAWAALAAVTTLLLALLLAAPASAQGTVPGSGETPMEETRLSSVATVSVAGRGEVRVDPDVATVNLGVTAQAADAGEAQDQANRTAQAILAAVEELGVEPRAVQTSSLNLYPVYGEQRPRREGQIEPQQPEIVGYRANNTVSVRLTDLEKVGPAIDVSVAAGANEVQGVNFDLDDDSAARRRALTRAVGEARSKAEAIAAALGRALGPVVSAQEAGVSIQRPQMAREEAMFRMAGDAMSSTPVSSGQVSVGAGVELIFRLMP